MGDDSATDGGGNRDSCHWPNLLMCLRAKYAYSDLLPTKYEWWKDWQKKKFPSFKFSEPV